MNTRLAQPIFRTINLVMALILRSRLHRLLSKHLALITVTGRKSGKAYTVPVSYQQQGAVLRTISVRHDRWWRNLRGGALVTLRLRGCEMSGHARVIEDVQELVPQLMMYLHRAPKSAKILGVRRDPQGQFRHEDLQQAAEKSVMVHVDLDQ